MFASAKGRKLLVWMLIWKTGSSPWWVTVSTFKNLLINCIRRDVVPKSLSYHRLSPRQNPHRHLLCI
ncbi:hypothetical protein LINGRAHAP2_LOCUS14204, partial [Linum grandiflorum]